MARYEPGKDSSYQRTPPRGREGFLQALISFLLGKSGYGAPLWLLAIFIFIVAYAVFTRETDQAPGGLFRRLGVPSMDAGRLDGRIEKLEERIRNNPNDIQALLEAGILKYQKGPDSYIDAISDLENARSKGAADVRIFYYLGRMYQAEGLYDFALDEYQRLINNRPDDFEARMLSAKLMFATGRYSQAAHEYEMLSEAHPGNVLVLENLALSRWKNKQDPAPVLDKMTGMGKEAAFRSRYISGRMAYENKDYAAAAPLLARVASESAEYKDFSDLALVYQMLSDSYIKLKSDPEAISALTELLKLSPSNEEASSQLARLMKARQRAAKENAKKDKARGKM